jgi:NAD+ synthase (glutamine-hydrolysing)
MRKILRRIAMRITLAQINPTVGDIAGNTQRLLDVVDKFHRESDLIIFPELYLTGYPPGDLLERPEFVTRTIQALHAIMSASGSYPEVGILFGMPLNSNLSRGKGLCNSAVLVCGGELLFKQDKSLLPFYDVFDESRYFDPASDIKTFMFKGKSLGITICEDAWNTAEIGRHEYKYRLDPQQELGGEGADILINISASPYYLTKEDLRYQIFKRHACKYGIPFIHVNQVGANDENFRWPQHGN